MPAIALHYEAQGDATAPVVIIVHGFFASTRNWRSVATQLAQHYYVVNVDMRSHGASPRAEPMDYPAMAEDLRALIQQLGFTQVSLIGHSMGGKVGLWFALHYPALVHKLIVVDISPTSYSHGFDDLIDALLTLPLATLQNRKQADVALSMAIPAAHTRQFLLQNLVLQDNQYVWRIDLALFKAAAATITAFPTSAHLPPYSSELLVLAGERSDLVQPATFLPHFPKAKFTTIANTGHWLQVEAPEAFLAAVNTYLAGE